MRMTVAEALVRFLELQEVERDGVRRPFFAGVFGIFGHGNVAGLGQALLERGRLRYHLAKNEQAMVHTAAAYAKASDRLATYACTTSIGPGATNLVTGAAGATINRLPVLLLPGDVFAGRGPDPVLQQLEDPTSRAATVNDCLRPVSRYFDRVQRPEQLASALWSAMRVLTSPADTGAVTICLPQDVQAEAFEPPPALLERRVWRVARPPPEPELVAEAAERLRRARRPLMVAGGGVLYSDATEALARLAARTGLPVAETQAGKGALVWDHPSAVGAAGVTGSRAAVELARRADLVLGVGTRWSDFTTGSRLLFEHPEVEFVGLNVVPMDALKQGGLPLVADARLGLEALERALGDHRVDVAYAEEIARRRADWDVEVDAALAPSDETPLAQAEILAAVREVAGREDAVVAAAGSLPGDLHKLWRATAPRSYHLEYGYSCMGYEIAGGLGVRLARPEHEVFVLVGDGSYLMMAQELATAVQESLRVVVVVVDNHGFGSIGALSRAVGGGGFGTAYRMRDAEGRLAGPPLPIDLVANARSLGAHAERADDRAALVRALRAAVEREGPSVVVVESDPSRAVALGGAWWDVPPAELARTPEAVEARADWAERVRHRRIRD